MPSTERIGTKTPRKLDRKKTLALAAAGMSQADIAKHQGVAQTTVYRFLQSQGAHCHSREIYKKHRAEVFADLQAKALDVQARILESLDDGVLSAAKPSEKSMLLNAINNTFGTIYDKERLENGQSTQNHSLVHRMMGSAFKESHKVEAIEAKPTPIEGQESRS